MARTDNMDHLKILLKLSCETCIKTTFRDFQYRVKGKPNILFQYKIFQALLTDNSNFTEAA